MSLTRFKHIVVSEANYKELKKLGQAGDSLNDVIIKLLKEYDKSE
jgi:predicted CopG family antitoxin